MFSLLLKDAFIVVQKCRNGCSLLFPLLLTDVHVLFMEAFIDLHRDIIFVVHSCLHCSMFSLILPKSYIVFSWLHCFSQMFTVLITEANIYVNSCLDRCHSCLPNCSKLFFVVAQRCLHCCSKLLKWLFSVVPVVVHRCLCCCSWQQSWYSVVFVVVHGSILRCSLLLVLLFTACRRLRFLHCCRKILTRRFCCFRCCSQMLA